MATTTITYDSAGTDTFDVPAGVEEITISVTGAGGSNDGGSSSGRFAGAGGGAFSKATVAVTPGETLDIRVGNKNDTNDPASAFKVSWVQRSSTNLCYAEAGTSDVLNGGIGGRAANGVGDITQSGGAGGAREGGPSPHAGGGGGGAGTVDGDGAAGTAANGGTGGTGGLNGSGEASGGDGGDSTGDDIGEVGVVPGGGAGGKGTTAASVAGAAGAIGQVVIEYEEVDLGPRSVVENRSLAKELTSKLKSRRSAFAMIGDSNVTFTSETIPTGWYQGWEKNLAAKYGIHGTGIYPAGGAIGPWGSWYNGVRARSGHNIGSAVAGDDASMPTELISLVPYDQSGTDDLDCARAAGVDDGDTAGSAGSEQLSIRDDGVLFDRTQLIRVGLQYGVWDTADVVNTPKLRINVTDGTNEAENIIDGDSVSNAYSLDEATVDLAANSRSSEVQVRYWKAGSVAWEGPSYVAFVWAELPGETKGIALSGLGQEGGGGARDALVRLQAVSDASLESWFALTRETLSAGDPLVVMLLHGGNDRNDTNASWGGSSFDGPASNTLAGFKNNMRGLMDEITARAEAAGYASSDIYYIHTYHPQDTHVSTLEGYEDAVRSLAELEDYRIIGIRGTMLTTPAEMTANSWYDPATSDAHLTQAGYEGYSQLSLDSLTTNAAKMLLLHGR